MAPNPPAARALARKLLASATPAPPGDPESALAAVSRVVRRLATELSRWFGPYGHHALLTRALVEARGDHPVLRSVLVGEPAEPYLVGLADAARAHGIDATLDGVEAVLAAFVDLLGRLIGEDLALAFVDRITLAVATDAADAATATDPSGRPPLERPS